MYIHTHTYIIRTYVRSNVYTYIHTHTYIHYVKFFGLQFQKTIYSISHNRLFFEIVILLVTIGWRAKVEDRQEWNGIVEQTKTHPGL